VTAPVPQTPVPHNGVMLMGNKKAQRITVGVIIGVMVVSLALSLISTASGTP
jgi:glucose uptake protein GlcU